MVSGLWVSVPMLVAAVLLLGWTVFEQIREWTR